MSHNNACVCVCVCVCARVLHACEPENTILKLASYKQSHAIVLCIVLYSDMIETWSNGIITWRYVVPTNQHVHNLVHTCYAQQNYLLLRAYPNGLTIDYNHWKESSIAQIK